MRNQGLEGYLDGTTASPPKVITTENGEKVLNLSYLQFVKLNNSLASWLLSDVSSEILPQLVGADTMVSIWNTILSRYSQLSTTQVIHLHCRLRSIKKASLSMRAYTMQIKEIYDLIASCGNPVSNVEHIATILNDLPLEYDSFVAVISASCDPYIVYGAISIHVDAE
ncbi:hypothetical protein GQ457_09G012110 [Hibiscus cannabinus]